MQVNGIYLDSLALTSASVGYGDLGMWGSLGYEGKMVSVRGQGCPHAFSAHPPARLCFKLDRQFSSFRSEVALNDDVTAGVSHADFVVLADGREVALEPYVRAGELPRTLTADISGANHLELVVQTSRWEYSHAIWLDPQVAETAAPASRLVDCLGRADIHLPSAMPRADRCIATVVSPGFEHLLDDMLGSFYANGGCPEALVLVFLLDGDETCERVVAKYRATPIRCQSRFRRNPMSKAILYSAARVADARQFVCLDADMLVVSELASVFAALDACPEGSILASREGNNSGFNHLGYALGFIYGGRDVDRTLLGLTAEEERYSLIVNDGLFAGGRAALLALDGVIRAMPQAAAWMDGHPTVRWRNQFVFNLALARLKCGVELDSSYNVQLHVQDVQLRAEGARVRADWNGRPARVLHFSGGAKRKYPAWQGRFAGVHDPLAGAGGGDAYAVFLKALRAWVGLYGLTGMAWSFYGLSDGAGAAVRDPSTLPLLAALHYLVRSSGCVRLLETGTARGISAACLASAVAHRNGGHVVTFDPYRHEGREELWSSLPEPFRSCIEAREVCSLEGMAAALRNRESYDAALLDSLHVEEHVWAEFQLAAQLVCPGGLILVHDACYAEGTVQGALRRIESAGYNVVRLWTAEAGVPEDDHLGLAVIENRLRHLGESQNLSLRTGFDQ
jgi:predicted O-methyltransferase YrrM